MRKEAKTELWQLKMALISLIGHLRHGVDHLDTLTCRTIARALAEIVQEVESFPKETSLEKIATFSGEVLVGTGEMQQTLETRWQDELQPLMERARNRAEALDHDLAEFTCLSVDGQEWGAICMKCLRWVTVRPDQSGGALLERCTGWVVNL